MINRGYGIILLLLFLEAIRVRLWFPLMPFSDPDTWGYLYPALHGIGRDEFIHHGGRSFPYPYFIYWILRIFDDFRAISLVQHALGLLSGGVMVWIWHRLTRFFPSSWAGLLAHRIIGVMIVASFLLSRGSLLMEHSIRPEAIFPFFTVLTAALGIEYLVAFYHRRNLRLAFFFAVALVFNALLVYFIKPAWGLAAGCAMLPIFFSWAHLRRHYLWKGASVAVPLVLALALLWYPEKRLTQKYDPRGERFLSQLLFCFNAPSMRKELAADLAPGATPLYDRALIARVLELVDLKLNEEGNTSYRSLGYDADDLMYRRKDKDGNRLDSVVSVVETHFGREDVASFKAFCMHYYLRAWRNQPGAMAGKILTQMMQFYRLRDDPFDRYGDIKLGPQAVRSDDGTKDLRWPLPVFEAYQAAVRADFDSPVVWKQPSVVSALNRLLRPTMVIGFVFSLVLAGVLAVRVAQGRFEGIDLLVPLLLVLYLYSLSFGNCLTVAVVHTMEVSRYVKNQLIFILLAQGAALWLAVLVVERLWHSWRKPPVVKEGAAT